MNQHPRFYCHKRGLCVEPLAWWKFDATANQPAVPIARQMILASCYGYQGKVLVTPDSGSFQVVRDFLCQHQVRWWAYPPDLPGAMEPDKSKVLTCDSFAHNCQWTCPTSHVEAKLNLALATLEQISKGKRNSLERRLARSAVEFLEAMEQQRKRRKK